MEFDDTDEPIELGEPDEIPMYNQAVNKIQRLEAQLAEAKKHVCCKYPDYCGGECTCKTCAPELHLAEALAMLKAANHAVAEDDVEIQGLESKFESLKESYCLAAESYDANARGWQEDIKRLRKVNTESKRLLRVVFDTWMPPSKIIDETYRNISAALEASDEI